jgi:hypothetical protein
VARGGERRGAGRPKGRLNDKTLEFRAALLEGIRVVLKHEPKLPQDPTIALGWALFTKGLGSSPECLVRLAEWIGGKPKETIEFDPPLGIGAGGYRCFLSDGRPLPTAALPVSAGAAPRRRA